MKTPSKPPSRRKERSAGRDAPARSGNESQAPQGDGNQGEGNVTAARRYDQATTDFAQSGRVEEAARRARPGSADEERALDAAEQEGLSHAKDEDPSVAQRHGR